jgi:hypothetical protein
MMRLIVPILLGCGLLPAAAQESPAASARITPKDKDKWGWMALLRDDAGSAMSRASLEKKQRKTLDKDVDVLRRAIDAHQGKAKFDQKQIDKSLRSIRQEFRSKAFSAEDRDRILEDLDHLPIKEAQAKQPKRRQQQPFPNPRTRGRIRF